LESRYRTLHGNRGAATFGVAYKEDNVLAIAGTGYGLIGLLIIILIVVLIFYLMRRA
jgi:hypothetical protein